jgi:hypothetical protein
VRQGEAAVAIGAIEHAVTEEALARGWRPQLAPAKRIDKDAAVIGAGPAGLAFAEAMNRAGWNVTVYDRDTRSAACSPAACRPSASTSARWTGAASCWSRPASVSSWVSRSMPNASCNCATGTKRSSSASARARRGTCPAGTRFVRRR